MTYVIDWASNGSQGIIGKTAIVLADKAYDSTSSSLVLTGKGVFNWGEIQQENFLHLLENFASNTAPLNPTVGQLWYNPTEVALYTCVDPSTVPSTIPVFHAVGTHAWIKTSSGSATEIATILGYIPVKSVNGKTGKDITLTPADIGGLDSNSSPTFNTINITNEVNTRGGVAAVINPPTPIDGDIKVASGIISIRANGAWKQVFPAVYS